MNVATVEYKPKKQLTSSGYGVIEPMAFVSSSGPAKLSNSMMPTGGIGIPDHSNDRGDEINLDEL